MEDLKEYKKLYLVDENDAVIRAATWEEIYSKKNKRFYTRVVHVWIFNGKKLLVQKRNKNLKLYPGFYESSASGHVDFGESYLKAAMRELREEVGIKIKIYPVMKLNIKECRNIAMLFIGFINEPDKKRIKIDKKEVERINFYSINKIREIVENKKFTPVFEEFFKRFFNGKKNSIGMNNIEVSKINKKILECINKIKN